MPRTRSTKSLWKDKTDRIVKRLGGEVGVQMQWSALQSERISVAPDSPDSPDSPPPDWRRTWLHSPTPELNEPSPDCTHTCTCKLTFNFTCFIFNFTCSCKHLQLQPQTDSAIYRCSFIFSSCGFTKLHWQLFSLAATNFDPNALVGQNTNLALNIFKDPTCFLWIAIIAITASHILSWR